MGQFRFVHSDHDQFIISFVLGHNNMQRTGAAFAQHQAAGAGHFIRIILDHFAGLQNLADALFRDFALKHALNGVNAEDERAGNHAGIIASRRNDNRHMLE